MAVTKVVIARSQTLDCLYAAAKQYGLDLSKCIVVGDNGDTDMLAAHAVGAKKILVRTGWGEGSLNEYRFKWEKTIPDYIATNINDAVKWILSSNQ